MAKPWSSVRPATCTTRHTGPCITTCTALRPVAATFGKGVYGIDLTGVAGADIDRVPTSPQLAQNAPNPFNPATTIAFDLPRASEVTLRIYNVEGRLVRTLLQGIQEAGPQTVVWSGKDDHGNQAASGLYFYRLATASGTLTRKMTLLK